MSSFDFEKPRIIYACNKCCTKLSKEGEKCFRCHSGVGVQIDPVPHHIAKIKPSDVYNNILYYECNGEIPSCTKEECHKHGGDCHLTKNIDYAVKK